jgi:4-aminobutyrate aminotransferase-like enzyme
MAIFTCTGSESNELALRMARQHTKAMGIICSDCAYHGNTVAVDELATMFNDGQAIGPNVISVPYPDTYRGLNDLEGDALVAAYVEKVIAAIEQFKRSGIGFAGMLVCPIFANEGLPNQPNGYLQKVANIVREAGGLLIFDEVQAGFGRTGEMWGHDYVGVVPDIVTLGKPMGNGYPLSAVIARADLVEEFRDRTMYFNTFAAGPVASAVGLAVLDVLEQEKLLDNARDVGRHVNEGLQSLQQRHELIGDVRVKGLFVAVELVSDRVKKTADPAAAKKVINLMKEQGVLISRMGRYDNVLKMRPPLCFSTENADQLLSTLDACLTQIF